MRLRPISLLVVATILAAGHGPLSADGRLLPSACALAIHEERIEFEDAQLEVELARTRLAAFERIFAMIDELHQAGAVERLVHLRARYDRDAARLTLERAELILQRQEALLEQFHVICDNGEEENESEGSSPLRTAHQRYLDADCDQQIKAVDVATVNLEFSREWRASVLELRKNAVATNTQVILAEMDVALEERRLADARRRAAVCRNALGRQPPGS